MVHHVAPVAEHISNAAKVGAEAPNHWFGVISAGADATTAPPDAIFASAGVAFASTDAAFALADAAFASADVAFASADVAFASADVAFAEANIASQRPKTSKNEAFTLLAMANEQKAWDYAVDKELSKNRAKPIKRRFKRVVCEASEDV